MERLFMLTAWKVGPPPSAKGGPQPRASSPSGRSTLTTSAPIWARISPAKGPASAWAISTTLMPSRGSESAMTGSSRGASSELTPCAPAPPYIKEDLPIDPSAPGGPRRPSRRMHVDFGYTARSRHARPIAPHLHAHIDHAALQARLQEHLPCRRPTALSRQAHGGRGGDRALRAGP